MPDRCSWEVISATGQMEGPEVQNILEVAARRLPDDRGACVEALVSSFFPVYFRGKFSF